MALLLLVAALLYVAGWLSYNLWAYRDFSQVRLCAPAGLNAHDAELFGSVFGWVTFVASPLIEELVFRRMLFTVMSRAHLGTAFTTASAVLFTLAHNQYYLSGVDFGNLVHLAISGFVFARVFLLRKSIVDSYLTHITSNCFVLLPKDFIFNGSCASVGLAVPAALLTATAASAIILSSRVSYVRLGAVRDPS